MTSSPLKSPPRLLDEANRIRLTSSCRDCDDIPKVDDAGMVLEENGTRIQIMHNGLRVLADAYYGNWMTTLIEGLKGHHEPQEERLFHAILQTLPDDAVMLEVGAFWSYYSLWFLKDHPKRRAICLEPDETYLSIGMRNAALNGLTPDFLLGALTISPR